MPAPPSTSPIAGPLHGVLLQASPAARSRSRNSGYVMTCTPSFTKKTCRRIAVQPSMSCAVSLPSSQPPGSEKSVGPKTATFSVPRNFILSRLNQDLKKSSSPPRSVRAHRCS
ncbi:hypothetical protein WJX72_009335 [[Myrmecia] bisecta]|uniref:Uncharacterized protein n=1 Tax=[Myrmecia] bisecta TaxID=41462 RepID=A0AAW1Q4M4_9CHLO